MHSFTKRMAFWLVVPIITGQLSAEELPKSRDPRIKIEVFAEQPQIVTPTGIDVDHRGRVFAIESNTHFRPEDYQGHPSDRVLVMSDSDNDGKADEITVFTDGLKFSMSVVVRPIWFPLYNPAEIANRKSEISNPKQSVYIATRSEIFLFHDDDGDDKADRKESIVRLETKGDYPHNGLAGFAIDPLGWMYFGFGENLGADYKIIGSDGKLLSGGGEGGNIYRCRLDGSHLNQVATGFWNPHANCFDAFGRLFSVDNDPDSRPPCRLLHVIPGGDYGYRFRNGRKGLHPFTAWNGEIPGTLPMVAGTGEAPSGIVAYESDGLPEEYLGNLFVTSWGDHRIDRFRLQPKGTSFTSLAEPLITGGEDFRPVGIATGPDGSLYCTDWVLRDYKLHGHGRIWKISPIKPRTEPVLDLVKVQQSSASDAMKLLFCSKRLDVRRVAARRLLEVDQLPNEIPGQPACQELLPRAPLEAAWLAAPTDLQAEKLLPEQRPAADVQLWSQLIPVLDGPHYLVDRLSPKEVTDRVFAGASKEFASSSHPNAQFALLAQLAELDYQNNRAVIPLVLSIDDPFVMAVVVNALTTQFSQENFARYLIPDATPNVKASAPRVRQVILLAARKLDPKNDELAAFGLVDPDPDVRRLAVQWVAEEKFSELKSEVEEIFSSKEVTPELFLTTLAALDMLNGKDPADFDKTPAEQYVLPLLKDEQRSPAVRAQALRLVSPTDDALDAAFFASLLKSDYEPLRVEAIRSLQSAKPEVSGELLRNLVADEKLDVQLRAAAMVGLATVAKTEPTGGPSRQLLKTFLTNSSPLPLRFESLRAARPLIADDAEIRGAVSEMAKTIITLPDEAVASKLADQIVLGFSEAKLNPPEAILSITETKPTNREEWLAQLNRGRDADPAAGRRIFFHPNGPGCFKCHLVDGRGGHVGPDLSRAIGTMNRIQLIQSILEPSREIAPQFVSWTFETKAGKIVTGMIVHENEGLTIVGNAEGQLIELKTSDIEARVLQKISVMPEKLADRMTLQELRDLIAFLDAQK
ncbi:MAG TPA: c-type cytochrome [Planctomycetaceae bacterium]|nr:c-type cytochrome [Planctomycetaceae bacterium]